MITLTIPQSLADITINQYRRLAVIDTSEPNSKWVPLFISIACNVPVPTVKRMKQKDVEDVIKLMGDFKDANKQNWPLQQKVDFNGVRYGFHPNLSNLTVGEFSDLETLCKDTYENLDRVMSILYRPITVESYKSYEIEPYSGTREWGDLTMDVAMGAIGFFLRTGTVYAIDSLNSSKAERRKARSKTSGGGTRLSILSRVATLCRLKPLLR